LPFDPADLVAMRMRPAAFAAICQVSKQTVSRWIKEGKVTLGPDGLLDPAVASRQVFERTDPGRLRARVFKQATATLSELRDRIAHLETDLAAARELGPRLRNAGRFEAEDEADRRLSRLIKAISSRIGEAIEAHAGGQLDAWLNELVAVEFYGQDLEEYRLELASDEEDS
jgi:hypothetical protein